MLTFKGKTMSNVSTETTNFSRRIGKLKSANEFYKKFHSEVGVTTRNKHGFFGRFKMHLLFMTRGKILTGSEAFYMIETAFDCSPICCNT